MSVTNGYDQFLRRTNLSALNGSTLLSRSAYSYDAASRLQTVSDGTNSGGYGYLANSPLVSQISFTNNGIQRMVTTKSYDYLNRLTAIQSSAGSSPVASFNYAYNSANQRTAITNTDSARWVYTYDSLGQVVSGKKYWSDGVAVAGQQYEYGFDDIGNRKSTAAGGNEFGANLRSAGYTNNALNQLASRSVPGYLGVLGSATNTATVTVNNQSTYRHSDYFRAELAATNGSAALWFGVTNLAVLNNGTNADIIASTTGFVFVAQSSEAFGYDADGNMTNDGRWALTWDGENRLQQMVSLTNGPTQSKRRLTFAYDYRGRRITKAVESWNGSSWAITSSNKFVYDGWNLATELNGTNNAAIRSYTWGLDLSGTLQGAGGVGGLLAMSDAGNGTHFFGYDGNGNVAALVDVDDGKMSANYEYGPFGELVRASGTAAKANLFRYSTKYQDEESGLLYYGYRYLDVSSGRWVSRDPLGVAGGFNPYRLVGNCPVDTVDFLGLILAAFDGTGNDAAQDSWRGKKSPSNIAIMTRLYSGQVIYKNGVGTRTDITTGNLFGDGVGERLDGAVQKLQKYLSDHPDEPVDIIGFSRGAASARIFANLVKKKLPCAKIRFLGLFDTVAQIGAPNDFNYQFGYDLSVHTDQVGFIAHAVAQNEYRSLFPLTSILDNYKQNRILSFLFGPASYGPGDFIEAMGENFWEKPFGGAHSDLGGGYPDTRNLDALRWMISQGQNAGAPFDNLESYSDFKNLKQMSTPHDSRYPFLDKDPLSPFDTGSHTRVIFPGGL